jgi:amino-acid N-acetyltransferase
MRTSTRVVLRSANASHAKKIHGLIASNREEGHLLPRALDEIEWHADRFVIAARGRAIVGCAELAPLNAHVAEIRSLAVDPIARHAGVGSMIVAELRQRARRDGFDKLCAFTHRPDYFARMGFSIVPHLWLAEKVFTDCVKCPLFRRCGQYGMVVSLDESTHDRAGDQPAINTLTLMSPLGAIETDETDRARRSHITGATSPRA